MEKQTNLFIFYVKFNKLFRHHMSALMYAARDNRPKIVEKLLNMKANPDKQDNRGYTVSPYSLLIAGYGFVKKKKKKIEKN